MSPRTAKPSGSARALYLALVARGLVVTIVRGDTILVRGIDRLCCEAHRNWVRQHIPPHKPELLALLRDGLEDQDLAPVLEEGRT